GEAQMRILAMLVMTLKGTPFFFAGDEIGMTNVAIPPDRVQDVFEKLVPAMASIAIPNARRCVGTAAAMAALPPASRGCPWAMTLASETSRVCNRIAAR